MMYPTEKETAAGEGAPTAPGDLRLRESQAKPPMTTGNASNSPARKREETTGGEFHAGERYRGLAGDRWRQRDCKERWRGATSGDNPTICDEKRLGVDHMLGAGARGGGSFLFFELD